MSTSGKNTSTHAPSQLLEIQDASSDDTTRDVATSTAKQIKKVRFVIPNDEGEGTDFEEYREQDQEKVENEDNHENGCYRANEIGADKTRDEEDYNEEDEEEQEDDDDDNDDEGSKINITKPQPKMQRGVQPEDKFVFSQRAMKRVSDQIVEENCPAGAQFKWEKQARDGLQTAAEQYILELLHKAQLNATSAGRNTLMRKDIWHIRRMMAPLPDV